MNTFILSSVLGQRYLRATTFATLALCTLGASVEAKPPDQALDGVFVSRVHVGIQLKIERRGGVYYYWDVPTDVACHTLGEPRRAKTVPLAKLQKRLGEPSIQARAIDLGALGVLVHTPKNWRLNSHFTTATGYFLWDQDDAQSSAQAWPGDMEKLKSYEDVCPSAGTVDNR